MLQLDEGINRPVPSGAVLPYLTALHVQQCRETWWPADAFPNLQSLHLEGASDDLPTQAVNIPGSSSIAELTLSLLTADSYPHPDAAHAQAMALALPQLRKLHLVVLCCFNDVVINLEQCVLPWMQALSAFTQLQELAISVPRCACDNCYSSSGPSSQAPPADVLLALHRLPQLQCITLCGWAWDVSPLFVVGLGAALTQLSSIRFEGCNGYNCGGKVGQHADPAAIRQGMVRVATGLRAGLQVEYVE
jgi:hypothetical protein